MTRIFRIGIVALAGPLLAACAGDMLTAHALKLEIRDAATGAAAAHGATVIVRQGAWADTLRGHELIPAGAKDENAWIGAADGRTGRFDVTVEHPGYAPWTQTGIEVRAHRSGSPFDGGSVPETVQVRVELQATGG